MAHVAFVVASASKSSQIHVQPAVKWFARSRTQMSSANGYVIHKPARYIGRFCFRGHKTEYSRVISRCVGPPSEPNHMGPVEPFVFWQVRINLAFPTRTTQFNGHCSEGANPERRSAGPRRNTADHCPIGPRTDRTRRKSTRHTEHNGTIYIVGLRLLRGAERCQNTKEC